MEMTEEVAWAIGQVVANRNTIISTLKLQPDVFDSWVKPDSVAAGVSPSDQSLQIILSWIRDIPELRRARQVLIRVRSEFGSTDK